MKTTTSHRRDICTCGNAKDARAATCRSCFKRDPTERLATKWVHDALTGCWIWKGQIDESGYGRFWFAGRNVSAHRFSYEHHIGAIAAGLTLDHICNTPACVNPAHLEPKTIAANIARRRRCECGECKTCRHRESERRRYADPAKAARIRAGVSRRAKVKRAIGAQPAITDMETPADFTAGETAVYNALPEGY